MSGKFLTRVLSLALLAVAGSAQAQVVISQVYGGAGCTSASCATYDRDYIELFNKGSSSITLNGYSVQYHSKSTSGAWSVSALPASVTIPAGAYYLIAESSSAAGNYVNVLPTPDLDVTTSPISMSATDGVVALVNSATALTCLSVSACGTDPTVIDLVGFGTAAIYRGSGAAPAPSKTTADLRATNGCTDSDNNNADFTAGTPSPRNSGTATNVCGGGGGSTNPGGSGNAAPASVPNDGTATTLLTVTPTPGTNPTSASYTVTADLSSIGGSATQMMYDDGATGGDVTANDGIFSYTATVATTTSPGSKSLPVTITDDQARVGNTNIALTVTAVPTAATIMQIQGHGVASPMNGQLVSTSGVVTIVGPKGFFMQDPTGDGDPTTSDGIYVFTSSAPSVSVGNAVLVAAKVQEYSGSTELTAPAVTVTNPTAPVMPQAYVLDANPPTSDPTTGPCVGTGSTINLPADGYQASNFACLDGMLVKMNDAVVTGATFGGKIVPTDPVGSDAVHTGLPNGFYATLASQPRPFRGPGALYPGLGGTIPVWNGEPQVIEVYFKGLGFAPGTDVAPYDNDTTDFVYHAGTRFSVTGVIQGYQPSGATSPIYELYPASMTTNLRATPADEVQPVSDPVDGTLTFGTQNLLHMFNDVLDGSADTGNCPSAPALGGSDWCPTTAQYQARLTKWARQVCSVLKAPVVLDVEEIESLAVAHDLAAKIADNTSTGHVGCGVTYQTYVIPGNDVGGINIGILVRSDVAVDSVTQLYKGTTTSYCSSGTSCLLNDRPPVLMQATWNGYKFALLAIYGRSLSGIDTKPYVGPKRAQQAAQIASIADAWQNGLTLTGAGNAQQAADGTITTGSFDVVGDASVPLVVAGDFNAYEFSDGYADVAGLITGNAVQSDNKYWPSPYTAPNPTLVDSGIRANPSLRYSFNYDGLAQEIDHIVLTRRAWQDFVRVENAHGNSDTSEASNVILDAGTPARAGDHDGQVMTLTIDRIFADGFGQQP